MVLFWVPRGLEFNFDWCQVIRARDLETYLHVDIVIV